MEEKELKRQDLEQEIEEKQEEAPEAEQAQEQEAVAQEEQTSVEEELQKLREEVAHWQAKADEYLDKYRRSLAEFSNYRKRQEQVREQEKLRLRMDVLKQLLPIVDDFERALESVPEEFQGESWVEGVLLIERKLKGLLEQFEVVPIEAVGKPFDPTYHSALLQEESDEFPEGTVMEELRKGYLIADQVLRPTLVKVSRGPGAKGKKEEPSEEEGDERGNGRKS